MRSHLLEQRTNHLIMKQNITASQWGEFERSKPEAAQRLQKHFSKWQRSVEQREFPHAFVSAQYEPIYMWFNVGRMIEIIERFDQSYSISSIHGGNDAEVVVKLPAYTTEQPQVYRSGSLCDALWEAVKSILEEEVTDATRETGPKPT